MCKPNCLLRKMGQGCGGIFHFWSRINMSPIIKMALDTLNLYELVG